MYIFDAGDLVVQLSVSREELCVLAADLEAPRLKYGTLPKYTNTVKRWKLLHFILQNEIILYSFTSIDVEDDDEDPVLLLRLTKNTSINLAGHNERDVC